MEPVGELSLEAADWDFFVWLLVIATEVIEVG